MNKMTSMGAINYIANHAMMNPTSYCVVLSQGNMSFYETIRHISSIWDRTWEIVTNSDNDNLLVIDINL